MTQIIRKQVYLEPVQDAIVKKRARMLGVTEAEIIRKAIGNQMSLFRVGGRDPDAWNR